MYTFDLTILVATEQSDLLLWRFCDEADLDLSSLDHHMHGDVEVWCDAYGLVHQVALTPDLYDEIVQHPPADGDVPVEVEAVGPDAPVSVSSTTLYELIASLPRVFL